MWRVFHVSGSQGGSPRCCCAGSSLTFSLYPSSLSAPPFLQFVVVVSIINFKPLTYDDYTYPPWANWVGWGIALSSMILVPAYVIYKFLSIRGSLWEVSSGWLLWHEGGGGCPVEVRQR